MYKNNLTSERRKDAKRHFKKYIASLRLRGKYKIHLIFSLFWMLIYSPSKAQLLLQRIDTVPVQIGGNLLKHPWAGGLNYCQFSSIDLNQDGIKDLFVFDRTGDRISTFINKGTANTVDYVNAPQYRSAFPALHDWALLVDYNCDGKEDIFTYSIGGMAVYKNISDSTNGLKFTLVTPLVYSKYYSNYVNLYISPVDIPSISDLDNDGDLDVLTFSIFGGVVEYHKNQSMELYRNCDSLKYTFTDGCWGKFATSYSPAVSMGIKCKGGPPSQQQVTGNNNKILHSGGCLLCLDMNGDGDKDLLIGDVLFSKMNLLTNGGDALSANITAQDTNFPSNSIPVNLTIFPCGYSLDVNNDGLKDLIVSPNAANTSNDFAGTWYYQNTGTKANSVFSYRQNDFLQKEMIETGSGAYPVFFDYNGDSLLDLIIGNFGYYSNSGTYQSKISLYLNIGTKTHPKFALITRNFANLSSLALSNMVPAFGDLDGDEDEDMLIGDSNGNLHYFENTAGAGNTVNFVLSESNYQGINVVSSAVPQIIDIDRDGKKDLLIGSSNGKLCYYQNISTTNTPDFSKITSAFGGVNVKKTGYYSGYSYPFLFDTKSGYELLVGSESGDIYYYNNIDSNLSGNFNLVDSMYLNMNEGTRSSPGGADINNDGWMDVVIGNYAGGLEFYGGGLFNSTSENEIKNDLSFNVYPNPASDNLTIRISNNRYALKRISIYNLLGQEVFGQNSSDNLVTINTSDFSSGMYICKVDFYSSVQEIVYSSGNFKKFIIRH